MTDRREQDAQWGALVGLAGQVKRVRRSLGVTQRQPQGQVAPFGFSGADVFDSVDTMDVLAFVPDEVYVTIRCKLALHFREFFAPATAAASGGGSTSGASSASSSASGGSSSPTSSAGSAHRHRMWTASGLPVVGGGPFAVKARTSEAGLDDIRFDLDGGSAGDAWTYDAESAHVHAVTIGGHAHGIEHTHTTPSHGHDLSFGVWKEAFPPSHSVALGIYRWSGSAWTLIVSISGLTSRVHELDVSQWVDGPGLYRFELQSLGGMPQGGRLGCDVAGFLLGAIKSA